MNLDVVSYMAGLLTFPAILVGLSILLGAISSVEDREREEELFDWKNSYKDKL